MKHQIHNWAKKVGQSFFSKLFPDSCLSCSAFVTKQGVVCPDCWQNLNFIERPFCEIKGTPFNTDFGDHIISADAIANPPDYDKARSATIHTNIARLLATRLKYGDRTDLAPWMANWMSRAGHTLIDETDIIIPVPLHPTRYLMRRFNQSAELARVISHRTKKPIITTALIRRKATKQQVGLNENQRMENVRGAFIVPTEQEIAVNGRNILLVDDVLTTGATVNAAARTLKKVGATKVNVLTFSQVVPDFVEKKPLKRQM